MITLRKSNERGHFNHGWLDTYHTFSFGDYHDPANVHFRSLRVINEDVVQPGQGFGTHPHRDMEIITVVLSGALQHKDSLGTGSVIRPGDVQRMTAGSGIFHSEFNPSTTEAVHLLQIWIMPNARGLNPSYDQKTFSPADRQGKLRLIVSPDGRDNSISINQDVDLYAASLAEGDVAELPIRAGRSAWLQLTKGSITLNGQRLQAGDGVAVSDESLLKIVGNEPADLLLFDLN